MFRIVFEDPSTGYEDVRLLDAPPKLGEKVDFYSGKLSGYRWTVMETIWHLSDMKMPDGKNVATIRVRLN